MGYDGLRHKGKIERCESGMIATGSYIQYLIHEQNPGNSCTRGRKETEIALER